MYIVCTNCTYILYNLKQTKNMLLLSFEDSTETYRMNNSNMHKYKCTYYIVDDNYMYRIEVKS